MLVIIFIIIFRSCLKVSAGLKCDSCTALHLYVRLRVLHFTNISHSNYSKHVHMCTDTNTQVPAHLSILIIQSTIYTLLKRKLTCFWALVSPFSPQDKDDDDDDDDDDDECTNDATNNGPNVGSGSCRMNNNNNQNL